MNTLQDSALPPVVRSYFEARGVDVVQQRILITEAYHPDHGWSAIAGGPIPYAWHTIDDMADRGYTQFTLECGGLDPDFSLDELTPETGLRG